MSISLPEREFRSRKEREGKKGFRSPSRRRDQEESQERSGVRAESVHFQEGARSHHNGKKVRERKKKGVANNRRPIILPKY